MGALVDEKGENYEKIIYGYTISFFNLIWLSE